MARSPLETQKQKDNGAGSLSSANVEQFALYEESKQDWSCTEVIGCDGKVIPDCYIAGDQELLDKALEIEKKYLKYSYDLGPSVKADVNHIAEYLAIEKRQARRTTTHLLGEGVIPKNAPSVMPIVYAPDSGLHTAEGVMDGLFCASNLDAKLIAAKGNMLPQEAIDMAKETGVLVFCDSVACEGLNSSALLDQIPKDLQGPDGKPIKVITYFNYVHNVDDSKDSPQPNKLEQPEMLRRAVAPHQVYFIANAVGGDRNDLFDRADGMAKLAATNDKLKPYTDKFFKPDDHHVGKYHTR